MSAAAAIDGGQIGGAWRFSAGRERHGAFDWRGRAALGNIAADGRRGIDGSCVLTLINAHQRQHGRKGEYSMVWKIRISCLRGKYVAVVVGSQVRDC